MKLIQAWVRPEKERDIVSQLQRSGINAYTKMEMSGRGRQKGFNVGEVHHDEVRKIWFMVAVPDDEWERTVEVIKDAAWTGHSGDGKIFVASLDQARTVRTRSYDGA